MGGSVLLVDTKNSYNERKLISMIWNVHYMWIYVAKSSFNTYHHYKVLVLRGIDVAA